MNKNLKIALAIFALSVVVLTGLDYIVNMTLYDYGLEFSMKWAMTYWTFYALAYQLIVLGCWRITRDTRVLFALELFVLSGTQDLVFFSLWNGGAYPPGDWTWLPFYWVFGRWNTTDQLVWSAMWTTVAAAVLMFPKKKLPAWR